MLPPRSSPLLPPSPPLLPPLPPGTQHFLCQYQVHLSPEPPQPHLGSLKHWCWFMLARNRDPCVGLKWPHRPPACAALSPARTCCLQSGSQGSPSALQPHPGCPKRRPSAPSVELSPQKSPHNTMAPAMASQEPQGPARKHSHRPAQARQPTHRCPPTPRDTLQGRQAAQARTHPQLEVASRSVPRPRGQLPPPASPASTGVKHGLGLQLVTSM